MCVYVGERLRKRENREKREIKNVYEDKKRDRLDERRRWATMHVEQE